VCFEKTSITPRTGRAPAAVEGGGFRDAMDFEYRGGIIIFDTRRHGGSAVRVDPFVQGV